jgi:hypothetical protein
VAGQHQQQGQQEAAATTAATKHLVGAVYGELRDEFGLVCDHGLRA